MLSQELKEALGMPDGAPPPWLINMQVRLSHSLCLVFKYSPTLVYIIVILYELSVFPFRDMALRHHIHT